jgi:selenocysteine lyase/cysteine desulfurase
VFGYILPVEQIAGLCRERGVPLIVDAAQSAGTLPVSLRQLGADFVTMPGHKGLLGPQGTGGLCIGRSVEICPFAVGGTGVQSFLETQPEEYPTRLEAGTLNSHGLAGLGAALDFLAETGMETIRSHEQKLARRFYEQVSKIPGVTVYGDFSTADRAPIVTLNISDWDSAQVSDELAERFGIATRPGAHCAPRFHRALGTEAQGAVRFSWSWANTMEETDAAAEAVRILAEE